MRNSCLGFVDILSARPRYDHGECKDTYLVGTLEFESMAAIKEAFMSDLGRACADDRRILAANEDVEMYLFDSGDG